MADAQCALLWIDGDTDAVAIFQEANFAQFIEPALNVSFDCQV